MALETSFRQLSVSLHRLHDALNGLKVTVGDTPADDEAALADGMENVVLDMMGALHETRRAALQAQKAVGHPPDLDNARRALTRCQERFHRIERQFATELAAFEPLKELERLGHERRAWLPWASMVKRGIEECRGPLEKTNKGLAACWQELAERVGSTSISIQNAIVGQKVVTRNARAKDEIGERPI